MARQKLVLGWANGEQVEVTLEGDMGHCERVSNLFVKDEIKAGLEYSFVALPCPEFQDGKTRVFVFNTNYTADELQHMQGALRQIAGDGTYE